MMEMDSLVSFFIPRFIPLSKGTIFNGEMNPGESILSMYGAVLNTVMVVQFIIQHEPNSGSYVGMTTITWEQTSNWFVFVYTQDVNSLGRHRSKESGTDYRRDDSDKSNDA